MPVIWTKDVFQNGIVLLKIIYGYPLLSVEWK